MNTYNVLCCYANVYDLYMYMYMFDISIYLIPQQNIHIQVFKLKTNFKSIKNAENLSKICSCLKSLSF